MGDVAQKSFCTLALAIRVLADEVIVVCLAAVQGDQILSSDWLRISIPKLADNSLALTSAVQGDEIARTSPFASIKSRVRFQLWTLIKATKDRLQIEPAVGIYPACGHFMHAAVEISREGQQRFIR